MYAVNNQPSLCGTEQSCSNITVHALACMRVKNNENGAVFEQWGEGVCMNVYVIAG